MLRAQGGVSGFDIRMSYDWLMPDWDHPHHIRKAEESYLLRLCQNATRQKKLPILTFNRGLARAGQIRSALGAKSLLLTRCLAPQWASYLNMRRLGVDYFLRSAFKSIYLLANDPEWGKAMQLFLPHDQQLSYRSLTEMSMEEAWISFVGLHLIFYAISYPFMDLTINLERLASDNTYRATVVAGLREHTGQAFDLGGAKIVNSMGVELHQMVILSCPMLQERLETLLILRQFDKKTKIFLRKAVAEILEQRPAAAQNQGEVSLSDLAGCGQEAWAQRLSKRPESAQHFEATLDTLEDTIFPPAFSFWTKPASQLI